MTFNLQPKMSPHFCRKSYELMLSKCWNCRADGKEQTAVVVRKQTWDCRTPCTSMSSIHNLPHILQCWTWTLNPLTYPGRESTFLHCIYTQLSGGRSGNQVLLLIQFRIVLKHFSSICPTIATWLEMCTCLLCVTLKFRLLLETQESNREHHHLFGDFFFTWNKKYNTIIFHALFHAFSWK